MNWSIQHGDCMIEGDGLSVDVIITDPPYCIGADVRRGGADAKALPAWDDTLNLEWIPRWAGMLAKGGAMVAFCGTRRAGQVWDAMLAAKLHPRQVFAWVKANPPPSLRRSFSSALEIGVWATKGVATTSPDATEHNVYFGPIETQGRIHPTQKPLGLMRWLVRQCSKPDDLICDPFCGSGSTGIAALMEGRRFLGIEREAEYAQAARARLDEWCRQGVLFGPFAGGGGTQEDWVHGRNL